MGLNAVTVFTVLCHGSAISIDESGLEGKVTLWLLAGMDAPLIISPLFETRFGLNGKMRKLEPMFVWETLSATKYCIKV